MKIHMMNKILLCAHKVLPFTCTYWHCKQEPGKSHLCKFLALRLQPDGCFRVLFPTSLRGIVEEQVHVSGTALPFNNQP